VSKLHKLTQKYSLGERLQKKVLGEQTYKELHPYGTKLVEAAEPLPSPAPLPDEEEIRRAQRRLVASRAGKTGRASTILSGDDEPLG
jgi:hypothetical protein